MDSTTVAAILSVTFLAPLFSSPLGGIISDRVFHAKRYPIIMIAFALSGFCCLAVMHTPEKWIAPVLFLTFGAIPLGRGSRPCDHAPDDDPGPVPTGGGLAP